MSGYAWVTLATNDSYSLGALVLAHSLKKCNTIHKLAVLITPSVSQPMREQLQSIFDVLKLVDVLDSKDEAHLALLKRPELGITFTKIHCWILTEFEKCVFLDADTLVVRNCDELFEREEFSAAPDVSWPDCFNSGVFVYKPSLVTFNNILQYAVEKGSFDGGDQGLLNQFFGKWATEDIKKHLPFVYNLTTIAAYSYIPAFKHYGSETRIVHFIGTEKPWLQKLDPTTKKVTSSSGSEHLTPFLQKWWDLFCENVHPKLDKNLGFANGLSLLPVEACSNYLADEPKTTDMLEPFKSYTESNDFRQYNFPYHPVRFKDFSEKLLNLQFLPVPKVFSIDANNSTENHQREKEKGLQKKIVAFEKRNQNNIYIKNLSESKFKLEKSSFDAVDINEFQRNKEINKANLFEIVKKNQQDLICLEKKLIDVINTNNSHIKTLESSVISKFPNTKYFENENTNNENEADQESKEITMTNKKEAEKQENPKPNNENEAEPKSKEITITNKEEAEKQENPKPTDCDGCDSFTPDEICINNYLEKNIEVYQPFQNQISRHCIDCGNLNSISSNKEVNNEKELTQYISPLPRFLTIPESDKRQSGNCFSNSFNELKKNISENTNLNIAVNHIPVKTHPNTLKSEASNFSAETKEEPYVQANDVEAEKFVLSTDTVNIENHQNNLLKSKSMPNLEMYNSSHTKSSITNSTSEPINKFNNFVRKYSLPKLKPLLPRQSASSKSNALSIPKITHYTEFLISSEYKEPTDLPKDKIGFMESHISSLRQKSDSIVSRKFGPLPYSSLIDVNESSTSNPKKQCIQFHNDQELFDFKTCKRQLGNKPKENSSEKYITPILPALKPLVPCKNKKSNLNKRRKSKEFSFHLEEKRMKKGNEVLENQNSGERSFLLIDATNEKNTTESTDEILKRLFNFSKDYLHYFDKENVKYEANKQVPFLYKDYDPLKLKTVIESTWSNLRTKNSATPEKIVCSKNFESNPVSLLKEEKNISNTKCIQSEKQKEKKIQKTSEIFMCKKSPTINVKSVFLGENKFSTSICTEIVLLRIAKIWRKKFQMFLNAFSDNAIGQVKMTFNIIPLPWLESDKTSEMFNKDFITTLSGLIRQNSSTKYISTIGNKKTSIFNTSINSKKQFEENCSLKNKNKNQDFFIEKINSTNGFVNCMGGSKRFSDIETTVRKSKKKFKAPAAKNTMYSINSNNYFCESLINEKKTHENMNFNEYIIENEAFDNKSYNDQHRLNEKSKEKKIVNDIDLRKEAIKKQSELLCVPNFETPRSSRVDFMSKEIASDVSKERITETIFCEKTKKNCSVIPKGDSEISLILPPNSYKTPPLSNKLITPLVKRNEHFYSEIKLNSNIFPYHNSPDETCDVAIKKAINKTNNFDDFPISPYHVSINRNNLEAAEEKHKMTASGLAGTIAQLSLDSEDRKESLSAYQDYLRRQNWEKGNMDYMGKDSFSNIWSKICEHINKKGLDDLKSNVEVLNQKGDQNAFLENQMQKLQSQLEKESLGSDKKGIQINKSQTEHQTEKITSLPAKEILPNVEKTTDISMNQPEKNKLAQMTASDTQFSSTQTPVVQPTTIASLKEKTENIGSNVFGGDPKPTSCDTLSKTPILPGDKKSAPVVQLSEAKVPQPVTPKAEKTSKPPLITETPATPISEKKAEDEPKLSSNSQEQAEPQPLSTKPSEPVNPDAKTIFPDSQINIQSAQSKQEIKPTSPNSQTLNASVISVVPNLDTKSTSSSEIIPTTTGPELKTKEPIITTPAILPSTTSSPVTPVTKSNEQIISTALTFSPTATSVAQTTLVGAAETSLATLPKEPKGTSIMQQITTSATNINAEVLPPSSAIIDSQKIIPSSEKKLEPELQTQAATKPSSIDKSSSETIKHESSVKLSDILQPKESIETKMKDKSHEQTKEQDKNTAVVPYCDVLKQAKDTEEKQKEKPRSQKSIEELKKRQSEIKVSELPPIPLPDSPVKTQPNYPQKEETKLSQSASQQVTSEESKDSCLKALSEGSLKDNGKQKKGVFSKILEIVGVSPKEKKEDEIENSKSVFYDCEGIPSAEKKKDLIANESSIKTVSEVPDKPVADTSKTQGEISSTNANEEGVPTSKSPRDEAMTTNKTDKSKDVNFDKNKTSNMLQSDTSSDRGNKQEKQKTKETQPKQEDSQSSNKKNKAKPKPPRNTAPSSMKTEEIKQLNNKDKKKESTIADSLKPTQQPEASSKAAEVLSVPSNESKKAKDSSSKLQESELVVPTESNIKDLEKKSCSEGKIKSDLDEILNKAKTEVEARMQETKQEGGEGLVVEESEVINTMKLIVGENKNENQAAGKKDTKNVQQNKQKTQKNGKLNKRGPQGPPAPSPSTKSEEIEEVKITSEEDRKKLKGQVSSSKLSDQILKAIPPPRRKAISDAKGEAQDLNVTNSDKTSSEVIVPSSQQPQLDSALENVKVQSDGAKSTNTPAGGKPTTENIKPANTNQGEGKKGEGKMKSASGPVPPPRNRSKPRQPTPPKNKSKK